MASPSRPPPPPSRSGDLSAALSDLPVFPLPNAVLFPGALLPLHIFEPRYREMIRQALATHRAMAVALVLEGPLDEHGDPPFAPIAGAGVIVDHTELPDGRYNILLRGEARVKLTELPFLPPYRRASAEIIHDEGEPAAASDITALLAVAAAFASDVRHKNPAFDFEVPASLPRERTPDFIAHYLVVDANERQSLLELRDPAERARRTLELLATQRAQLNRRHSGPPSLRDPSPPSPLPDRQGKGEPERCFLPEALPSPRRWGGAGGEVSAHLFPAGSSPLPATVAKGRG